jgi:nitroreductase
VRVKAKSPRRHVSLGERMDVAEAVAKRRAKRVISDRHIEPDKVEALVESARLSASCFNNQPWRMVLCMGSDSLGEVKSALPRGNAWATRSPLVIVVAAESKDDCQLSGGRDYYLFDCGLAIGQLELMATELGLIAHPIAGYDPVKVKNALGIPENFVVITLVICGYPGDDDTLLSDKQRESERERPARKPVGQNFYVDAWGNPFG